MKYMLKKRVLFPLIFASELVILIAIANIFGLETENTLYGAVFVFIIFATFIGFLLKIVKDHKDELATMKIPFITSSALKHIYFLIALTTVILIFLVIDVLFGIF